MDLLISTLLHGVLCLLTMMNGVIRHCVAVSLPQCLLVQMLLSGLVPYIMTTSRLNLLLSQQ